MQRATQAKKIAPNKIIESSRAEERYQKAQERVLCAEELARNEAARADIAEAKIMAIYESYSWKITMPFRLGLEICKYLTRLPKKIIIMLDMYLRRMISVFGRRVLEIGFIAKPLEKVLRKFPRLFDRLYSIIISDNRNIPRFEQQTIPDNELLSPRAQKIYYYLKRAIEKKKK